MNQVVFFSQFIDKNKAGLPQVSANSDKLATLLTILFALAGAIAVFFLVIAGLKYITSGGDPARVASAKNQIVYTVIGLIIAATAAAAVNFILGRA